MKNSSMLTKLRCVGAALTALFMVGVFPPYGVYPFLWICLTPLLFSVDDVSYIRAFFISYLSGILFFTALVYWLIHVTGIGVVGLVIYLSLYFPLFIVSIKWLRQSLRIPYLISAPLVWCACEYVRATLMTGFPWDNLGYGVYTDMSLLQVAELTGVSGLSFIAVLGNAAVYHSLKKSIITYQRHTKVISGIVKNLVPLIVFVVMIVALRGWGHHQYQQYREYGTNKPALKLALIQANIPQNLKWDEAFIDEILNTYDTLTRKAALEKPDMIVWPESSLPGLFQYDATATYLMFTLVKDLNIPILFGGNRYEVTDDEYYYYNSAYLLVPGMDTVRTYDKIHLVPYGEYVPNKKVLKRLFPSLESVVPFEDFTPGRDVTLFDVNNTQFGVSICYEDIFPELVRLAPEKCADFIVNITNDAWYLNTSAPYQHFYMALFRAVENRVPFIRCANTGITGYAAPSGDMYSFKGEGGSEIFETGYFIVDVPIDNDRAKTFYTRYGDIAFPLCFGVSVLLLSISFVYSLLKTGK